MSTIKVANIQHPDAANPAITLADDGSLTLPSSFAAISDLSDVDTTGVADGDFLQYDLTSGDWLPGPLLLTETTTRTANYTLALTDQGKVVPMDGSSLTLTVPTNTDVAFPIGSVVNVYNLNSTDVEIKGDTGVTVRNAGDLAEYGEISLRKRGTDEWVVAGNLS